MIEHKLILTHHWLNNIIIPIYLFILGVNKVVRRLTEKPENTLSPAMWIGVNPAYRLENNNKTHFKETFKGRRE